ncbi:hypothetical protein BC938DRAFT_475995 [Jimgerdemannia flammicorona]|uniref:Uncharacterized protein n=1 Tax=Jimgerdemannia flammicorona TaxID=994334 RepID=A0A433QR29_9FUNG|nr:hypothetical protein BC938DRAFT_475995 [Jimgerdemannia flammicorona]
MYIHNPKFAANSQAGIINGGTFLNLSSGYQDEINKKRKSPNGEQDVEVKRGKSEQARNDDDSISSDIGDENSIGDFPPKSTMGTENLLFTPHKQSVEDDMVKRFINDLPLICAFGMSSEQLELAVGPKLAQQTISVRSQNPSSWTPATVKYLNDVFSKNTGQHFESAIQSSIDDDDDGHFRLYCKKILVDFYHLVDCNPTMSRDVSERKFIVYNIASLFKFYETTFGTVAFEWIETHARAAKISKSATISEIIKVDAKGIRLSDNEEIWHLEVAGPPSNPTSRHSIGDTKKILRTDIFKLVSILRNHLDCKIELATRIKVFSSLVIGKWQFCAVIMAANTGYSEILNHSLFSDDRLTLYAMNMLEDGRFFATELATTTMPFTFSGRTKYKTVLRLMGIFHFPKYSRSCLPMQDELITQAAVLEEIDCEVLRPEGKTVRDVLRLPEELMLQT